MNRATALTAALLLAASLTGCGKASDFTSQETKQTLGYQQGYALGKAINMDIYRGEYATAELACKRHQERETGTVPIPANQIEYWENWQLGCADGLNDRNY